MSRSAENLDASDMIPLSISFLGILFCKTESAAEGDILCEITARKLRGNEGGRESGERLGVE